MPSLIIWLIFKDRARFTDTEAKGTQLSDHRLLVSVALTIVSAILTVITFGRFGVLTPHISLAIWAVGVVFSAQGFLRAKDSTGNRYPYAVRVITWRCG